MGILRGPRTIRFTVEFQIGPNMMSDDELKLYAVGLRNMLAVMMMQGMAGAKPPSADQAHAIEVEPFSGSLPNARPQ